MSENDGDVYAAATMYYLQGLTMDSVASQLGVSRSTVSRLLASARECGIVRISVAPRPGSKDSLSGFFERTFHVRTTIVPLRAGLHARGRSEAVSRVAADIVAEAVQPNSVLGLAWGNTVSEVVHFLPQDPKPGSVVVQLNGAANFSSDELPYADGIMSMAATALGARPVMFPVPAFFDHVETKEALWRERSVQRVLETIEQTSVALFGVGAVEARSRVYVNGYLDADDLDSAIQQGAVGDVCTVLLRQNGTYADIDLNARASGPTPAALRKIPRRICVVSGVAKAPALLAALKAGVATDLVLDDATARAVLDLIGIKRRD